MNPSSTTMQFNVDENTIDSSSHMDVVAEVAQTVMKNPTIFGGLVYDLTAGNAERDDRKRFCDEENKMEPIADADRLRGIVSINCFGLSDKREFGGGTGLFVTASYFNHSCVPNASWRVYDDVLVSLSLKHGSTFNGGNRGSVLHSMKPHANNS